MDADAVEIRVVGCLLENRDPVVEYVERGYVERLPRRRGQREQRYRHLLGSNTQA